MKPMQWCEWKYRLLAFTLFLNLQLKLKLICAPGIILPLNGRK